jgi:hypothetical protein
VSRPVGGRTRVAHNLTQVARADWLECKDNLRGLRIGV